MKQDTFEAILGLVVALCLAYVLLFAWRACGLILQAGADRWFIRAIFFVGLLTLAAITTFLCRRWFK